MCRLAAYIGCDILLEDILVKPVNSLVKQSLNAQESHYPTNGDGFGLGWYAPEISPDPGLFTSISPAWNDRNLLSLTSKIKSPCFFAHVRAASSGGVSQYNCHPFKYKQWMLMHNGNIHDFIVVKRHLRHLLDDDIYHWIQGETDSEHLFALFLQMAKGRDLRSFDAVADLTQDVFRQIHDLVNRYASRGNSFLNLCLTDGKRVLASRYCSDKRYRPESMHYSIGNRFALANHCYHMLQPDENPKCVLITSEKLDNFSEEWHDVPEHHLLMVNSNLEIQFRAL